MESSKAKSDASTEKRQEDEDYFQDDEQTDSKKAGAAVGDLKKQSSYTYWVQNNRD